MYFYTWNLNSCCMLLYSSIEPFRNLAMLPKIDKLTSLASVNFQKRNRFAFTIERWLLKKNYNPFWVWEFVNLNCWLLSNDIDFDVSLELWIDKKSLYILLKLLKGEQNLPSPFIQELSKKENQHTCNYSNGIADMRCILIYPVVVFWRVV